MNPLTNVRNVTKLSQRELEGRHGKTSWHDEYKDSAWIFVGGLPYDLTEGDVLTVFSQWGEIVNLNMIRDKATGKFKGFGFICYENQKSTVLAVDNFNGIKILGRTVRVDHVKDYKPPKDTDKLDDITRQLYEQGCAPQVAADSSAKTVVGGYVLLESDGEEEERDDGLGTHSVLKGIPDRRASPPPSQELRRTSSAPDEDDRSKRKRKVEEPEKRQDDDKAKKERRTDTSHKKHHKKDSRKTKHSKSKKDKKRSKRRRSDSSDSESSSDSSSSSSSSSDTSSSSSSDSESEKRKSKSSKRKHKRN